MALAKSRMTGMVAMLYRRHSGEGRRPSPKSRLDSLAKLHIMIWWQKNKMDPRNKSGMTVVVSMRWGWCSPTIVTPAKAGK
jgi:hypothetical protein